MRKTENPSQFPSCALGQLLVHCGCGCKVPGGWHARTALLNSPTGLVKEVQTQSHEVLTNGFPHAPEDVHGILVTPVVQHPHDVHVAGALGGGNRVCITHNV